MSRKESIAKSFGRPTLSEESSDGETLTRDQAYEEDYSGGGEFWVQPLTVLENDDDELTLAGYYVQGSISSFCYWSFATEEEAQKRADFMNQELVKTRGF